MMSVHLMKRFNRKNIILVFLMSVCYGQTLQIGDVIPESLGLPYCFNNGTGNDSLLLHDFNGETNEMGQYSVILLNFFASW